MTATRKLVLGFAAAAALSAFSAGCGSVGDITMPFTGPKGLLGKSEAAPDLPDRPKLVMPAPNAPLPVPGQTAPAQAQFAAPAQQQNQQAADAAPKAAAKSSGWFSGLFGSDQAKKTQ